MFAALLRRGDKRCLLVLCNVVASMFVKDEEEEANTIDSRF
jgi:hypothetical protein